MKSTKELIKAIDEDGNPQIIERAMVAANSGAHGRPRQLELYRLVTGELVNCVGPKEFIATSSGIRLRGV